jgi:Spy/CpxP family protein refolding chaperone
MQNLSAVSRLEIEEHTMTLTTEQREAVAGELKTLAGTLNLTDDQKQKVSAFMSEAREKVEAYKQQNPNATQDDLINKIKSNRTALRGQLVNFLTPEQLTKWDAGVAGMKEVWGQKVAA